MLNSVVYLLYIHLLKHQNNQKSFSSQAFSTQHFPPVRSVFLSAFYTLVSYKSIRAGQRYLFLNIMEKIKIQCQKCLLLSLTVVLIGNSSP